MDCMTNNQFTNSSLHLVLFMFHESNNYLTISNSHQSKHLSQLYLNNTYLLFHHRVTDTLNSSENGSFAKFSEEMLCGLQRRPLVYH